MLKIDPTFGLPPPIRKEKARERDLSPAEIRVLWNALDNAPVSRPMRRQNGDFPMTRATALALKLALVTAQRIGEVTGIVRTELDLNETAPMWTVPGERSKNGKANRVPLSPLALRLIADARELSGDNPWLFPSPTGAGPIDPHAPTKALERARPSIGLDDFRVHDLRRTAATRMAEMGTSPHTISLVLNHATARRGQLQARCMCSIAMTVKSGRLSPRGACDLSRSLRTRRTTRLFSFVSRLGIRRNSGGETRQSFDLRSAGHAVVRRCMDHLRFERM